MNRRPSWRDVPGIVLDISIAVALFASIWFPFWWLAQHNPN